MTNEEAKMAILTYCVEECGMIESCDLMTTGNCVEAIAIKALEKQIPKKPILHDELFLGEKIKYPYCPNCGDSFNCNEFGDSMKFCWNCGQAIDWSENND